MKLRIHKSAVAGVVATLTLGTLSALGAVGAPSAGAAGDDDVTLPRAAHGPQAVRLLGGQLDDAAALNDRTPAELSELLLDDRTAWLDRSGRLYYVEPVAPQAATAPSGTGDAPYLLADTFTLHSKADSQRVLYLDFDGEVVTGTNWNTPGYPTLDASAFSTDGDATSFSATEREVVQSVWQRVAEDYAPFDIDVTTEDPGAAAIERTADTDQRFGTRALITSDDEVWGAVCQRSCGGVAFVDVFDAVGSATYHPAWVFTGGTGAEAKGIAEAASHEVGHNFGLDHDGNASSGYDGGREPWAPIMGVSYYQPITQWSKGEYAGANNRQDDVAVIAGHGAPYRSDEAGSTVATAANGLPTATSYVASAADSDVFALGRCAGEVVLDALPARESPDLDISLSLLAADGSTIVTDDPVSALIDLDRASGMSASISQTLPAAAYFLRVQGAATGDGVTGYTTYGSIGSYTLARSGSGSCAERTVPAAPTAPSATRGGGTVTLAWAPPTSDGGSAVSGYTVRIDGGSPVPLDASARSYPFTGQGAGAHTLQVAAVNIIGTGPAATAGVAALSAPKAPSPPRIGKAVPGAKKGKVTATTQWSPPASTNGSVVQRYQVFAYQLDASGRVVRTVPTPALSASARKVAMRLPAGRYRFAVRAANSAGWSALSAQSNVVKAR